MIRYTVVIIYILCGTLSLAQAAIDRDVFLDTCLRVAEARDPKLQVAKMTTELAGTKMFRSGRNFFPALMLQHTTERGRTADNTLSVSGNFVDEEYQSQQLGVKVAQPIFTGGRLSSVYKYDKLSKEVSQLQYTKLREELFYKIKSAYYELMAARTEAEKLKEAYAEIAKLGDKSEVEFKAKAISELDLLEAQIFCDKVSTMYQSAELTSRLAEERLLTLANINSLEEIIYELPSKIAEPRDISFSFKECFGFAMTNNIDIKITELFIKMNKQKKNIDIAHVIPNITAEGFYGKSGDAYVTEPLDLATVWTASAKLTWGIWGNSFEASQTQEKTNPSEVIDVGQKVDNTTIDLRLSLLDDVDYLVNSKEDEVNFRQAQAENQETISRARLELNKYFDDYLVSMGNARNALQEIDLKTRKLAVLRKRNEMYEVTTLEVMDGVYQLSGAIAAYSKALSANYDSIASMERMTLVPLR